MKFINMIFIFFIICLIAVILAFYFSNNQKNINPKKNEIYFNNEDPLNITGIYHCIILGNYPLRNKMTNEFIFTDGIKFYQVKMTEEEYKILFSLIKKSKELK